MRTHSMTLLGKRRITVSEDGTVTIGLRWWQGVVWSGRKDKQGRPYPTEIEIPAYAIAGLWHAETALRRRPMIGIHAPGYGDVWRASGRERQHRIAFGDGYGPAVTVMTMAIDSARSGEPFSIPPRYRGTWRPRRGGRSGSRWGRSSSPWMSERIAR